MYIRYSPIWKGEVGVLVWVDYFPTLFDGLTRGLYNLCDTASFITSSSDYGVKFIGLPVLGSSFVHTEAEAKLNVEPLEDTTLL